MSTSKLRVYRINDGIYERMVAAKNQREAAELIGGTPVGIRNYGGRVREDSDEETLALSEPGRVFLRDSRRNGRDQPWLYADTGEPAEPPPPDPARTLAEAIADDLLNGHDHIWWCDAYGAPWAGLAREAIVDRIEKLLRGHRP